MAVELGRKGWLGVAKETTAGVPVTPADYIPFVSNTLQGKQESIADTAAYGIRDEQSENSKDGQKHGEGTLEINMDATNVGYFVLAAMGSQSNNSEGDGVYTHTFSRNNSNTPQTLSLTYDKSVSGSRELFTYATVSSLQLSFSTDNEFAQASAEVMSRFPVATSSGTLSTTSGSLLCFKMAEVQFGTDLTAAEAASPTKVTNFSVTINNNSDMRWRSGDNDVSFIDVKNFMIEGEVDLFFEDTTERDNYYNNTKQAAIITLTGNGIGNDMEEFVKIRIAKMRYSDHEIETGIDDLFASTITFTGEYSSSDSKTMDVQLRNRKASY